MRANEFLQESELVQEIDRIPQGQYTGGKESLYDKESGKTVKKLPGGSGLYYSIVDNTRFGLPSIEVKIWDPNGKEYLDLKNNFDPNNEPKRKARESQWDFNRRLRDYKNNVKYVNSPGQLVGQLILRHYHQFPLKGAVKVDTITVDEDYRGIGLAKALYGIVLTIMKRPLVAGETQTPGGRRNWVSLSQIPGVEMKGYAAIDDIYLRTDPKEVGKAQANRASTNIDTIMSKLGGQYIGKNSYDDHVFAFDVKPNTTGKELESYVSTNLSKVYGHNNECVTGLYAVWTGQ